MSRIWVSLCLPGLISTLRKRIQLFHRHRKLFAKQVDQARNASRAARHHDALNVFAASRVARKEVERFLNFERQYIRKRSVKSAVFVRRSRWAGFSPLFSGVPRPSKLRSNSFCSASVYWLPPTLHVARKQRDAAANDVDVHHARADIQTAQPSGPHQVHS